MMDHKKKLTELLIHRENMKRALHKQYEIHQKTKSKIAQRELILKLELKNRISQASDEIKKTKYSSMDKRKAEYERLCSNDTPLAELKTAAETTEKNLLWYETEDAIAKLHEKYLFKQIDLYIATSEPQKNINN